MLESLRPSHFKADRLSVWIAISLLVAMLGQSLLPTLAYLRSATSPALWDEICSVYGNRQIRVAVSDSVDSSDTAKDTKSQAPMRHAQCPLCLHMISDVILAVPQMSAAFHVLFLNSLDAVVSRGRFYSTYTSLVEARGPPTFN